jgi:hypothetical protein
VQARGLAADVYYVVAEATDDKGAIGYSLANDFEITEATGPRLRIRLDTVGGARVVTLEWDQAQAILEHTFALPGTWESVPNAASPYPVPPTPKMEFFRLRLP